MKIIHYTHVNHPPEVGLRAVLYPVDHPSALVSNGGVPVYTSTVQAIDLNTGTIVTMNTVYVPVPLSYSYILDCGDWPMVPS